MIYWTNLSFDNYDVGWKVVIGRYWEQGWRSGAGTRLPPVWPAFDSQTWSQMWVEFVGSLLCSERVFSVHSDFVIVKTPTFHLTSVKLI